MHSSFEEPQPADAFAQVHLLGRRISDIVLLVRSADRCIVEANPAAELAYGYSRAELLSLRLPDLRAPRVHQDFERFFDGAGAGDGVSEETHRRSDGSRFPVEVSVQGWAEHGETYLLHIIRDVTERRRIEARLVRARDRAIEVSQAKTAFVATTSHEIRNPMSAIIGMAELLLETHLDDEQRSYATTMLSSAQSLLALMTDVLDFSKIEAGKTILEEADFPLHQVIADVLGVLHAQAAPKGIAVRAQVAPDAPLCLFGDVAKLRQVLLNLGSNALKFTDSGSVTIHAVPIAEESTTIALRFEVCDTGIGIHPAAASAIFEPYAQDRTHGRGSAGTGLGLAIARRLVELLGGTIGVQSAPGAGSTFWFTAKFGLGSMPLPAPAAASIWKSSDSPAERRGHILIVEDLLPNQQIVAAQLSKLGYTADIAGNGRAAVAAAAGGRYDAILMDCQLPILDGYEATAQIRALERDVHIPIIAMTGNASSDDRRKCLAAGMNDFLAKPARLADLQAVLERALLEQAPVVQAIIDTARLQDLFDGDVPAISEVIGLAVAACEDALRKLGADITARSPEGAGPAHQLRGTAFNIGADALAKLAGQLQADVASARWAAAARLLDAARAEFDRVRAAALRLYPLAASGSSPC